MSKEFEEEKLPQTLEEFRAAAMVAETEADFDGARALLRKVKDCLNQMQREAERARIKAQVDRKHGRTERHEMVARKVLLDGMSLKEVGDLIGVKGPRVRQLIDEFCRGRNRQVFDYEFHRSPSLEQLRENSAKFFN